MAKARPIQGLGTTTPLGKAAARTIEVRTAELFELAHGVLDTNDIERVHDMRVATRRLRAALEAYRPCFPKGRFKTALRDVKALADALGARRDPDVALETIEAIAQHLPPAARAGVDFFESELRAEQEGGNIALERALAQAATEQLEQRLLELAASADGAGESFGAHADATVPAHRERLRKRIRQALERQTPEALHATRIAAKRLRYLFEITEPCLGSDARAGAKRMRGLQDLLGELHDCDVMSQRIRANAELIPLDDDRYIGLEALASYLEAKRRVLHREFVRVWAQSEA